MIGRIIKWLNPLNPILDKLSELYKKKLETEDFKEKLRIEAEIKVLEMRRDILLDEQKHAYTAWIRPAFALLMWFLLAKIVVWDTMFGLGVTTLSPFVEKVFAIVLGFYFLTRPLEKVFRK